MKKDSWFYLVALASGLLVWVVISAATGKNEAWDSSWYFLIGIPVMCAVSMALGFLEPARSWRWGLAPVVGQFVWMLLSQGAGALLPLGVIVFGVLSVPSILAAWLGAFFGKKREATAADLG